MFCILNRMGDGYVVVLCCLLLCCFIDFMCLRRLLVEEVPAYAEAEDSFLVERIVRREEIVAVALSGVHVTHHYEEACVLEVEVGVDVHYGVVAPLPCGCCLPACRTVPMPGCSLARNTW